ncbi:MAG TPA: hypothetical protein VHN80_02835 [Kineosporiaceae bacterium]|nr:hypothetical protein [Kineosporiaceae bacterium]
MSEWSAPTRLQQEWVACAIAAAASRFIPVPLLDDLVKERATRTAVSRTWQAHGRPPADPVIRLLAGDSSGGVRGWLRSASRVPLAVMLYPWRKVTRIVTSVHGVTSDLVGVLLLARSVDRCLTAGWFTSSDPETLRQNAQLVRRAHDQAVAGVDLRLLEHSIGMGLRQVSGLQAQAQRYARRAFGRPAGQGRPGQLADGAAPPPRTQTEAGVETGVREVEAVLDRPEVTDLLSTLDRRFDTALASLAGTRSARPTDRSA